MYFRVQSIFRYYHFEIPVVSEGFSIAPAPSTFWITELANDDGHAYLCFPSSGITSYWLIASELKNTPIFLLYKKLIPFSEISLSSRDRFYDSCSTRVSATPVKVLYHTFFLPKSLPSNLNFCLLCALVSSPPLGDSGFCVSFDFCFLVVCEFKE